MFFAQILAPAHGAHACETSPRLAPVFENMNLSTRPPECDPEVGYCSRRSSGA
jgi:hypothetical protein